MYDTTAEVDQDEALHTYATFLSDTPRFTRALKRVVQEWPISCEQFLTNESINRLAWLGQASLCIETGLPRIFRAGFCLLSSKQQAKANAVADHALQKWKRQDAPLFDGMGETRLVHEVGMAAQIRNYIEVWESRGYEEGLPDQVPAGLMEDNLAPSYKKIVFAVLKNDHTLQSLGFIPKQSLWYSAIKKIELDERVKMR